MILSGEYKETLRRRLNKILETRDTVYIMPLLGLGINNPNFRYFNNTLEIAADIGYSQIRLESEHYKVKDNVTVYCVYDDRAEWESNVDKFIDRDLDEFIEGCANETPEKPFKMRCAVNIKSIPDGDYGHRVGCSVRATGFYGSIHGDIYLHEDIINILHESNNSILWPRA
jgi:hypothetical protein